MKKFSIFFLIILAITGACFGGKNQELISQKSLNALTPKQQRYFTIFMFACDDYNKNYSDLPKDMNFETFLALYPKTTNHQDKSMQDFINTALKICPANTFNEIIASCDKQN